MIHKNSHFILNTYKLEGQDRLVVIDLPFFVTLAFVIGP